MVLFFKHGDLQVNRSDPGDLIMEDIVAEAAELFNIWFRDPINQQAYLSGMTNRVRDLSGAYSVGSGGSSDEDLFIPTLPPDIVGGSVNITQTFDFNSLSKDDGCTPDNVNVSE